MAKKKGTPNKKTTEICELIDRAALGPLEFHLAVLNLDYKKLKIDSPKRTEWTGSGIEYEVDAITLDQRMDSAKTLMKYRYSQKQAVDVTSGGEPLKLIIEDYSERTKG